jgi:hypothetical protein
MIDANILLQSRPVQIQTPLEAQAQVQQVQNLRNLGQLQKGQIAMQPGELELQAKQVAAAEQENQQRQLALDNQRFTNDAIARNIKVDPQTGQASIDHAGVSSTLAAGGHGVAALNYTRAATDVQKGVLEVQQAGETLNQNRVQHLGSLAGAVLNVPLGPNGDTTARAATYAAARLSAIQHHQINPGDLPDVYTPEMDAKLGALRDQGITPAQQVTEKNAASLAASSAKRADALEARAEAFQESVSARADREAAQSAETARHNRETERQGQERIDKPRTASTAGARTANQKEFDSAQKEEQKQDGIRSGIGSALKDGNTYFAPNGQTVSFDKQIPQKKDEEDEDYQARRAKLVKSYQNEMRVRLEQATTAANAATARKNNATLANGAVPDVSTAQAIAKRGGQAAPSASGQAPQYTKFANDGKGNRLGLLNGQWVPIPK